MRPRFLGADGAAESELALAGRPLFLPLADAPAEVDEDDDDVDDDDEEPEERLPPYSTRMYNVALLNSLRMPSAKSGVKSSTFNTRLVSIFFCLGS